MTHRSRSFHAGRLGWPGGRASGPIQARLFEILKASPKLFADETRAPVLDPGRKKVKLGQLWAYARDDRDPPGVAYCYASGRGVDHVQAHLESFSGILQTDGYTAYKGLVKTREDSAPIVLSFCWAHLRRRFYDIAVGGNAPIAEDALHQIAALYKIEEHIRGQSAEQRQNARHAGRARSSMRSRPGWMPLSPACQADRNWPM